MSFNKGYELKKFEAHWEKLRIEYAAAGMTEEAIQKMYDYDRQQFNWSVPLSSGRRNSPLLRMKALRKKRRL